MRGGLLFPSFLLLLFLSTLKTVRAQNFENDKRILTENLLEIYNGKDSTWSVDDFFEKNAVILNCNKRIDKFFGVETALYSRIRNYRVNDNFFADSLDKYLKAILPADFDQLMLNKQQSKYDIIYLLLKKTTADTASLNNFITTRLNAQTEIETVIFVKNVFSQYFRNLFPSIMSKNERFFKTDYYKIYSQDSYDELLSTGKWDRGEAAVYSEEVLMVLYKQEYLKMTSANAFIKYFKATPSLFKKAFYLDIALSKKINADSIIETVLKSPLDNNFKIFAINQTLKQTKQAFVIDICYKALREFSSNIKFPVVPPKTVLDNTNASNFFTYSGIVAYCCANRTPFADSCLEQLQLKSQYNWSLFTELVNKRVIGNEEFINRHIKALARIPGDFFRTKKNIKKEYPVFVYPPEQEYSLFLPKYYLDNRSAKMGDDDIDSLFEKLFTTPEYLECIKNSFSTDSSSKENSKHFSKRALINLLNDSAANFLARGYAFYNLLTQQPQLIPAVMKKVPAIRTQAGLFQMATMLNLPDKSNYLSKEFDRTIGVFKARTNEEFFDEEPFYLTIALEYFRGRETDKFYTTVRKFLSDTTKSYKLSSIILNQYPQFFYDDSMIDNSKRKWYLDHLSKVINIQSWEHIIPILNPADKNFVKDLFYRSRS
jgi:hypothetical protein